MPEAHCPRCAAYEVKVMAAKSDDAPEPCDDYEMTTTFRDWLVQQMRQEVLGQISQAGLDRMAVLKGNGTDRDEQE